MEKSNPNLITLYYPHQLGLRYSSTDAETWLFLLEQSLAYEYKDYKLTITENNYSQLMTVEILFSNIDDATLFRLKMQN